MDWIKKHTDTVLIMSAILTSFLWMNSQINELKKEVFEIQKDVAVVKTIMVMKNIMPAELATCEKKNEK